MADSMPAYPSAMAAETAEIPDRLEVVLAHYADSLSDGRLPPRPRHLYTVARGSSDHAASILHWVFVRAGILATTLPPSLLPHPDTATRGVSLGDSVVLGISQSGASPDLVDALQRARQAGAASVALVNQTDSPLARAADTTLPVLAGPEHAVAATKSLVCSVVAGISLADAWREGHPLLDPGALVEGWRGALQEPISRGLLDLFGGTGPMLVIGRGTGFGVAGEIALKIQELLARPAMAYSSAEVLHGPAGMIKNGYPVLALEAGPQRAAVAGSADRLEAMGASIVRLHALAQDDELAPLLLLGVVYRALEHACRLAGRSPDKPEHLHKVTLTH